MALTILNNIAAIAAENQLNITSNSLNSTLEQLSSGSRINSGADDPAGLAIANGLSANIAALTQSASNATGGVGELQVADGALSQVTTLLNRAVTLATESATGTVSNPQRLALDNEYQSIKTEIDSIGSTTNYNGGQVFTNNTLNVFLGDGSATGSSLIGVTTGLLSSTGLGVGGSQATATLTQQGEVNAADATATLAGGNFTAGDATSTLTAGTIVGSTQASGSITTNGSIPLAGDIITVGSGGNAAYKFVTGATVNAGDVSIGATGAASLANLAAAINLSSGALAAGAGVYDEATINGNASASLTGNILTITDRANGTANVALTLTGTSDSSLSLQGVTGGNLSGGTLGSSVAVGGTTYQFVTALDSVLAANSLTATNKGIANQVLAGSSATQALTNLAEAVNLTQGGDQGAGGQYGAATVQNAEVSAGTAAAGVITFTALAAGTVLNGTTPTVSSPTVGTFSTFAGGGNPSTVTLGATTYTFTNYTPISGANQVLVGSSGLATLANLANAINNANTDTAGSGGSGTGYSAGGAANGSASAGTAVPGSLVLTALTAGTAGNNIVLANTAGATGAFSGGAAQINAGGVVVAGDSVDVAGQTYNFVTALSSNPVADQVVVGATEALSFTNLANAVNGATTGAGTTYSSNTTANTSVTAATTATPSVVFTAINGGAAGNAFVAVATPEGTVPDLSFGTGATAGFTGGGLVPSNLLTSSNAQAALSLIDTAVASVAALRGNIGATVNRLQSASNVINNQVQNLTAAENNVTAADIPTAVANLTQYSILEQTGISALAQANQQQQLVLKLLT
jgi:flagellin